MIDPILPLQKRTNTFPFDSLYEEYIPQLAPIYERNYAARSARLVDGSVTEVSSTEQAKDSTGTPAFHPKATTTFTQRFFLVNTRVPLILEIVFSLFIGLFGVGWLLIGKKRTGTILLIGSLLFYLPLLIISYGMAYFSYGLSILCTGPFVVGAVLLNAFMLHKSTQRMRQ